MSKYNKLTNIILFILHVLSSSLSNNTEDRAFSVDELFSNSAYWEFNEGIAKCAIQVLISTIEENVPIELSSLHNINTPYALYYFICNYKHYYVKEILKSEDNIVVTVIVCEKDKKMEAASREQCRGVDFKVFKVIKYNSSSIICIRENNKKMNTNTIHNLGYNAFAYHVKHFEEMQPIYCGIPYKKKKLDTKVNKSLHIKVFEFHDHIVLTNVKDDIILIKFEYSTNWNIYFVFVHEEENMIEWDMFFENMINMKNDILVPLKKVLIGEEVHLFKDVEHQEVKNKHFKDNNSARFASISIDRINIGDL